MSPLSATKSTNCSTVEGRTTFLSEKTRQRNITRGTQADRARKDGVGVVFCWKEDLRQCALLKKLIFPLGHQKTPRSNNSKKCSEHCRAKRLRQPSLDEYAPLKLTGAAFGVSGILISSSFRMGFGIALKSSSRGAGISFSSMGWGVGIDCRAVELITSGGGSEFNNK